MYKSKVYTILTYFDKIEQNRVRKYITSPYFNVNEHLVQLFELLIAHINTGNTVVMEKEPIWNRIFPDKTYNDTRFRKLCSDLLKLIEGYLAQQVFEENPLYQATYLIEAVGQRKMEKLYSSTMRSARRLSNQQLHRPANYYFYQYQVERNYYELSESDLNRAKISNIEKIINYLDRFFLAEKLRLYCETLIRRNVISHSYDILFIDEIIKHIDEFDYSDIPAISIYHQIQLSRTEFDNEEHYFKLKQLIEQHWDLFPNKQAKEIYTFAINYCIGKINKGKSKFLEEFILLNEDLLKKGLLTEGELSPWKFKNIVTAALRLDMFDWTKNFINKYHDKIPEGYRSNAVTFNMSKVYWYEKDYDKVIELLREVEYEDIFYNLDSKVILLITYYEVDEIEPLYSLLDSFRVFLNRHKEIKLDKRQTYLNLIKFVKRLTKIMPGDQKAIDKLKKEVEETSGIANAKWLKEKIAEME